MKVIYIIRHVSGSGSSTLANNLIDLLDERYEGQICCADDFMVNESGQYEFSVTKLGYVHHKCREVFLNATKNEVNLIIVNNTSVRHEDWSYYLKTGEENGYTVFVMVLENYHENKDVHGCPEITLEKQENLLRQSLKLR